MDLLFIVATNAILDIDMNTLIEILFKTARITREKLFLSHHKFAPINLSTTNIVLQCNREFAAKYPRILSRSYGENSTAFDNISDYLYTVSWPLAVFLTHL